MIDCPKCGFSQPEDRYCANCGIDMTAFKPPTVPLTKRILGNWIFQAAAFLAVIAVAAVFLRIQRNAAELAARLESVAQIPEARPVASPPPEAKAQPARAKAAVRAAEARPPASDAAVSADTLGMAGKKIVDGDAPVEVAVGTAAAAGTGAAATAAPAAPKNLRIILGEFRRGFVTELLSSARDESALNSSGAYSGGVAALPDAVARIGRETPSSAATSTDALAANQPISVFKGVRDNQSRNVGFTILVTPGQLDENGVTLNVEVVRAMRDGQTVQEQSFPDVFALKAQRIGFMTGLVPKRAPDGIERELYASTPLNILTSASFVSGATDFLAIFVPLP